MLEDINDELEGFRWVKALNALLKLALLDQFEVKDVIDKANQKVKMRHYEKNNFSLSLVICDFEQTLQKH